MTRRSGQKKALYISASVTSSFELDLGKVQNTRYLYIRAVDKSDYVTVEIEGRIIRDDNPLQKIQISGVILEPQMTISCSNNDFHLELQSVRILGNRKGNVISLFECASLELIVSESTFADTHIHVEAGETSNLQFINVEMIKISNTDILSGIRAHYPARNGKHILHVSTSIFQSNDQYYNDDEPNAAIVLKADKSDSEVQVTILNSVFIDNSRGLDFSLKGISDIRVDGCNFTEQHSVGSGGATRFTATLSRGLGSIATVKNTQIAITSSVFVNNSAVTNLNMTRTDLYFQTRSAGYGGAIHVFLKAQSALDHYGLVKIDSCYFENNTADIQGGTFFFNPDICVLLKNTEVINSVNTTKAKLGDLMYASSNMTVLNTIMHVIRSDDAPVISYQASDPANAQLKLDNFMLMCPTGHELSVVDTPSLAVGGGLETLRISCLACSPGFYSLNTSGIIIDDISLTITSPVQCDECPYGATCMAGILNRGSFWGIRDDANSVEMSLCPEDYCQQNAYQMISYDNCASDRDGILCGRCRDGYSESMFGAVCVPNEECGTQNWYIAVFMAAYGVAYVLFFMFERDAATYLQKIIIKLKNSRNTGEPAGEEEDFTDSGFFQIFMYFIQTSVLLKVVIVIEEDVLYQYIYRPQDILPEYLIDGIKEMFNFDILALHGKTCLLPDLTPSLKVIIKSLFVLYLFFILLILYILSGFCCVCKPVNKRPVFGDISWNSRIIATIVSLFLYTYQYIAEDAFLLLNCVSVDGDSVLFYEGDIQCFQDWQYAVVILVCVYVIPFFLVLLFGPKLVEKRLISVGILFLGFLFPLFVSLPLILIYFNCIKRQPRPLESEDDPKYNRSVNCCGKKEEVADNIVDVMSGPYKNDVMKGVCWEGVINFRRLILVLLFTFINDKLIRLMSLSLACFIILLIHIFSWPFKMNYANIAETISLSLLLVISGTNLVKAAFFHSQAVPRGVNYVVIVIYEWIETVCLGLLPLVILLLLILAIVVKTTIALTSKSKEDEKHEHDHLHTSGSLDTPPLSFLSPPRMMFESSNWSLRSRPSANGRRRLPRFRERPPHSTDSSHPFDSPVHGNLLTVPLTNGHHTDAPSGSHSSQHISRNPTPGGSPFLSRNPSPSGSPYNTLDLPHAVRRHDSPGLGNRYRSDFVSYP